MFPSNKIFLLLILLFFLQACSVSTTSKGKFSKPSSLLLTASLINPAMGLGTLISGASSLQKGYAALDIIYFANEGESMAESALSNANKKDCKLINIIENQNICL